MNIYQSIKKFVRPLVVIGGLVALVSGCGQVAGLRVRADLNKDGIPDEVYYIITYDDSNKSHDIYVSLGGSLQPSKRIIHLENLAIKLNVEDTNKDGVLDITYATLGLWTWGVERYVALGNGDGTFQTPQKLSR